MKHFLFIFSTLLFSILANTLSQAQNLDTISVTSIDIDGIAYPLGWIEPVTIFGEDKLSNDRRVYLNRLRYNVNKVYPYALTAATILNDVDKELARFDKKKDKKAFLKTKEKMLNERFKNELKDLSVNQGKLLVKLINRETGRDCYSVIKDLKGGLNARVSQTFAQIFDNDLKKQYDPFNEDKDVEMIVREIEGKYYQLYQPKKAPELNNK